MNLYKPEVLRKYVNIRQLNLNPIFHWLQELCSLQAAEIYKKTVANIPKGLGKDVRHFFLRL